jgi:hypothetical protein
VDFEQTPRNEGGYQKRHNAANQHCRQQSTKPPGKKLEEIFAFEESQCNDKTRDNKKQSDAVAAEPK